MNQFFWVAKSEVSYAVFRPSLVESGPGPDTGSAKSGSNPDPDQGFWRKICKNLYLKTNLEKNAIYVYNQ